MGRKQHLLATGMGHGFFDNGRAAGAQQFQAGLPAVREFVRMRRRRSVQGNPKLRRGGVVDQQKTALLVLNRHAVGKHSENISQNTQLGFGDLRIAWGTALHSHGACQTLL